MLTVLETLGPAERAVFVLREVFENPYEEIAEAVDKSPAAVRQIAHRARDHVAGRRPRMPVSTTEQQEAVDRFLVAIRHGDLQGLLDVLAPDVVVVADGGGLVAAARRPIEGAERVAGLLTRGLRSVDFEAKAVWLNGSPAIRLDVWGVRSCDGSCCAICDHAVTTLAAPDPESPTAVVGFHHAPRKALTEAGDHRRP